MRRKLVLLDLKLPKGDGMQALKRVKEDPRTRVLPMVLKTSSKEERERVIRYNLGVNSYLQKPMDLDDFPKMVKQMGLYWLITNQPSVTGGTPHLVGQAK